jgi:RimJ/RimL family protein N-acetyltransferase
MSFRSAHITDTELLWEWRHEAEMEGAAGGWWKGKPTSLADHTIWLIRNIDLIRILVWEEGEPMGMVRIESNGEISFHVPKWLRETGVPYRMLTAAKTFAGDYGGRLKATVDEGNFEAWEALRLAGFVEYPVRFLAYKEAA